MPLDADQLPESIAGSYEIVRKIGEGGMASVFLARDVKHDRVVALKVCKPELTTPTGTERFLREVKTLARLSHPRILALHDSGSSGGRLYYVTPFVDGESLRQRLNRGAVPRAELLNLARQIAEALDYAHQNGIVHRDVKPENVLLSGANAFVADFGIARAIGGHDANSGDALTGTGIIVGSPRYMSPEQVSGDQSVDGRSDQYSFACVVYEMLAGGPPFAGPTTQSVLLAHLTEPVPPLASREVHVDPAVDAVMARALAKAPAMRFASARAFVDALAAALDDTSETAIVHTDATLSANRRGWRKRMALIAASVVVGAGAGGMLWQRTARAREQTNADAALVLARGDYFAGRYADAVKRLRPLADAAEISDTTRRELLGYLARSHMAAGERANASSVLGQLVSLKPPLPLLIPALESPELVALYIDALREKVVQQTVVRNDAPRSDRAVIAVYPLLARSEGDRPDSTATQFARGTTALLGMELVGRPGITMVEREVRTAKPGVVDASAGAFSLRTLGETAMPETHILFGTLSMRERQMFLSTWLVEVGTGALVHTHQLLASDSLFYQLVAKVAADIAHAVNVRADSVPKTKMSLSQAMQAARSVSDTKATGTDTVKPPRKMPLAAAVLYARALEAMDSGKDAEAIFLFRQVRDKAPWYEPASNALARLMERQKR